VQSVIERLTHHGTFRALLTRIRQLAALTESNASGVVAADGLWGSFAPILAGMVARSLGRPLLYVTAHLDQADEVRDDLELFCGVDPSLLSAFETVPGQGAASDEIHAERLSLCARLRDHATARTDTSADRSHTPVPAEMPFDVIVAPIQALMQPVPAAQYLQSAMLTLTVGERRDPRAVADWLIEHGYTRLDQVESPGDFAIRGDILDIFPPAEADAYRVDFFDETIESIRAFDVGTQRSDREFSVLRVPEMPAMRQAGGSASRPGKSTACPDGSDTTSFLS